MIYITRPQGSLGDTTAYPVRRADDFVKCTDPACPWLKLDLPRPRGPHAHPVFNPKEPAND